MLKGSGRLADLVYAVSKLVINLPPPGDQTVPSWHTLAGPPSGRLHPVASG